MDEIFSEIGLKDNERRCGNCLVVFETSNFYRDGKNPDGSIKYRRDCKNCYRITRLKSRRAKRTSLDITPKTKGRRKR